MTTSGAGDNTEVQRLAAEIKNKVMAHGALCHEVMMGRVSHTQRANSIDDIAAAIDRLASLARNDHMSTRKADLLAEGGHKFTGYVMHKEGDRAVIIDGGAVRWLTDSDLWTLMHVEGSTVARNEQPASQVQEADALFDALKHGDEVHQAWLKEAIRCFNAGLQIPPAVQAVTAPASPPGWVLVPIEPNEDMHIAAVRTLIKCTGNDDFPPRVWRAMIGAAPKPGDTKP